MIDILFQFPDWPKKLRGKINELNLFVAAQVQFNVGMRFDKEGAWNVRPRWAPLKFRQGQILTDRGVLRKSIAPYNPKGRAGPDGIVRFAGDEVTVGTKLLYARMMNDGTTKMPGGVLRPVNAKALKIPLPKGAKATETTIGLRKADIANQLGKLQKQLSNTQDYKAAQDISRRMNSLKKKLDRKKAGNEDAFIFRKSVKIPARPYDDWNAMDQAELDAAVLNKVVEILNR